MPPESKLYRLKEKLRTLPTRQLILISAFVVVGVGILVFTHAATPTASIEAENGTKTGVSTIANGSASGGSYIKFGSGSGSTCGANVANYTYQVPFGNSPWNIPACNLPVFANNQTVAANFGARVYEYATAWNASSQYFQDLIPEQKGSIVTSFGLAGSSADYSTPIYHGNASTPRRQVKLCKETISTEGNCFPSNLEIADLDTCWNGSNLQHCMAPDTTIPFDPSWVSSSGNDREMVIIDDTTNYTYELWGVDPAGGSCFWRDVVIGTNTRLCVASAMTVRNNAGQQTSIYNYNQGVVDHRGMGIQNTAMIVTPEEVQAGEIRHAMTMEIWNAMYGPDCGSQLGTTVPSDILSKNCGYAVAPATKFEWRNATDIAHINLCSGQADLPANFNTGQTFRQLMTMNTTIPEGMRFRLTWTDAQITAWINSRADLVANPTKANTARIFAVALRDYGFIPGDQTCYHAGITTAGSANPDAKAKWAALGINDASSQYLLAGLFQSNNIVALNPPTNVCVDGSTTQFYCKWTSSHY